MGSQAPPHFATISEDGLHVAGLDQAALEEWTLDLPLDAAATKVWLDQLTNATAELGPTTVTWH